MAGTRLKVTWELTGKEMMISYFTDTNSFPFLFASCKSLTCCAWQRLMPTGSCMSICINLTSFHLNLVGRKYHNVISGVKPFLRWLLFCGAITQQVGKYFTRFANLHLLFPTQLHHTFADGSVYKPAEIAGLELPGRTLLPLVGGTFFDRPARFAAFAILINS